MSLYDKLKRVCLGLMIAVACTGVASAQQTGTAQQDGSPSDMQRERQRRGRFGGGRDHKMMGMMRALRELDLTHEQQLQARAIIERFAQSTKPQREALQQLRGEYEQGASREQMGERAKQLRGEIREAMQRARGEVIALLTAEQRTKFEQMELEKKARHEERRKRFRGQQENEQ